MQEVFHRKVSPLERVFLVLEKMDPPMANQMVIEGAGILDEARLREAVRVAGEANPGSRLIYRGHSMWARWVDSGVDVPVRIVDGAGWSGYGPVGAAFLTDRLPFSGSHSCEVLLVRGDPSRVIFRTLHAIMDGRGTIMWVEDIFRALRGEPPIGSFSTVTDVELVSLLNYPPRMPMKPRDCLAPTGSVDGGAFGHTWRRATINGRVSKLVPQVALMVANETRRKGPGNVRLYVAVDLRPRMPDIRSTANLIRRITLDIPPESTVESIWTQMRERLNNLSGDPRVMKLLCYLPMGWLQRLFTRLRERNLSSGRFRSTGAISNLGNMPMASFRGGGFEAHSVFFVPPGTEGKTSSIVLAGSGDALEITVAMPNALATQGRLEEFLSNVVSGVKRA